MARKSWPEKLADPRLHEIKPAPIDIAGMKAGELMLVPTARMIDAFIRAIPTGKAMGVKELRAALARRFRAQVCCPITTGFHLRTVAEAAYEAHLDGLGVEAITPFWRVIDAGAPTARKLACGIAFIVERRRAEGLA